MKPTSTKTLLTVIVLIAAGVVTAPAQSSELDQLKASMKTAKDHGGNAAENRETGNEKGLAPAPGTNAGEGVTFTAPTKPIAGHASPVADRDNMNDQQVPYPG